MHVHRLTADERLHAAHARAQQAVAVDSLVRGPVLQRC